jgi:hypothetical protein
MPTPEQGRSRQRTGKQAEEAFLPFIRRYYPAAVRTTGKGRGDYDHIGDNICEFTTTGWPHMNAKLGQAARDRAACGYDRAFVIKRNDGRAGMGAPHYVWLEDADVALPALYRLEELERAEAASADSWQQGYDRGLADGLRAAEALRREAAG